MQRRVFGIVLVLLAAATGGLSYLAARGESGRSPPEVGLLAVGAQTYQAAFWRGLERNGLVDGRDLVVRSAVGSGDPADLDKLAAELVRRRVSAIVATSSSAVEAAMRQTTGIPIVSVTSADPLGSGFIETYSRPGKNVTGLAGVEPAVAPKTLQLLQMAAPDARRFAVFWNPTHPVHPAFLDGLEKYAAAAGLQIVRVKVEGAADVAPAFAAIDAQDAQALVVLVDPAINRSRDDIVRAANERNMPAIYPLGEFTKAGGLMSYGVDYADLHERAADYVAKLLNGARAAETPMERPLNFELLVNLTTAERLNAKLPSELLLRARTIRQSPP